MAESWRDVAKPREGISGSPAKVTFLPSLSNLAIQWQAISPLDQAAASAIEIGSSTPSEQHKFGGMPNKEKEFWAIMPKLPSDPPFHTSLSNGRHYHQFTKRPHPLYKSAATLLWTDGNLRGCQEKEFGAILLKSPSNPPFQTSPSNDRQCHH